MQRRTAQQVRRLADDLAAEEVADTEDPILRNYLITQSYWELSEALIERLGGANLVWPTFGSWASAQAGRHMRMESPWFARFAPEKAQERIVQALGRGNRRVFSDIAPPIEDFLDLLDALGPVTKTTPFGDDPERIAEELADRLGLDPRPLDEHDEGQQLMLIALTQYYLAARTSNSETRAERIFVANCCIGLQEQRRIDCMLEHLLDVDEINELAPWITLPLALCWWSSGPLRWLVKTAGETEIGLLDELGAAIEHAEREVRVWEACIFDESFSEVAGTHLFMNLQLGGRRLDLDDDVPPASDAADYPSELVTFETDSDRFRSYLRDVFRWDRLPNSLEHSAADDWSDLDDRMAYIVDLFRVRQDDMSLRQNPLTLERPTGPCAAEAGPTWTKRGEDRRL